MFCSLSCISSRVSMRGKKKLFTMTKSWTAFSCCCYHGTNIICSLRGITFMYFLESRLFFRVLNDNGFISEVLNYLVISCFFFAKCISNFRTNCLSCLKWQISKASLKSDMNRLMARFLFSHFFTLS